jgi:hypothetical protein
LDIGAERFVCMVAGGFISIRSVAADERLTHASQTRPSPDEAR